MNLSELKQQIDRIIEQNKWRPNEDVLEFPIMVKLDNPQWGPVAMTEVKSINVGFDWEARKIILWTVDPIMKYDKAELGPDGYWKPTEEKP